MQRSNVHVAGNGPTTLVFAHGFGCDQHMWRLMAPSFEDRCRVVTLDLVGSGMSDLASYDKARHATLQGHADDLLEVIAAAAGDTDTSAGKARIVFIGHSVSAMIGMLAALKAPGAIDAQVMIGPSPCYINHGDYIGGFEQADIDSLLETLESNYLGWSSSMAPAIMGAPGQPDLGVELTNSFCRTDPDIAKHFARVTFMSDNRADLPRLQTPTLILQCTDDLIAPQAVGTYMARMLPNAHLTLIENTGHCPHLSAPGPCTSAVNEFLDTLGR